MLINTETLESCIAIAKGCHDYQGGYHDKSENEIYHHGIQTVINCLEAFKKKGFSDMQIAIIHSIGSKSD